MNSRWYVHKLGLNYWSGKGRMVHWEYFVSLLSSILRTFVVKWNLLNFRNFFGLFAAKTVDNRIWIWENHWKTINVNSQFVKKKDIWWWWSVGNKTIKLPSLKSSSKKGLGLHGVPLWPIPVRRQRLNKVSVYTKLMYAFPSLLACQKKAGMMQCVHCQKTSKSWGMEMRRSLDFCFMIGLTSSFLQWNVCNSCV